LKLGSTKNGPCQKEKKQLLPEAFKLQQEIMDRMGCRLLSRSKVLLLCNAIFFLDLNHLTTTNRTLFTLFFQALQVLFVKEHIFGFFVSLGLSFSHAPDKTKEDTFQG
jgi:hypothetical protein